MSVDFSFPSLLRQQTFWYGNSSPTLAMREFLVLSKDTSLPNSLHIGQWLTGISEIVEESKELGNVCTTTDTPTWTHGHTHWTRTQPQLWLHRCPQTRHYPQQTSHSQVSQMVISSSSWAGRGWNPLVWHTHLIPQLHKHTRLWFPQALAPPLPQWWEIKVAAGSCS